MVFSIVTKLYNPHHYLISEHSSAPKLNTMPISSHFPFPTPSPSQLLLPTPTSASTDLRILDISYYKWPHHFTFPPAIYEGSNFSTVSQKLLLSIFFCYYSLPSGSEVMYYLPRTAVTNHHKLYDLKQQKFIFSQFLGLEL